MDDGDREATLSAVAALAEPTRRRLYDSVVRSPAPLSRDEVAAATGVPRATAAFHLDRLVAEGLLTVTFERRTGRTGPGAGRPAKLYSRADGTIAVSVPERRYDLAGHLLATAMDRADEAGVSPRVVLAQEAYRQGRDLGADAWSIADAGEDGADVVLDVLEGEGFEPCRTDDQLTLVNCPFHALAREHRELVCGMNLRLLEGVLDGVGDTGLAARLEPVPGNCCVRIGPASAD
jgi:predicted ArsR family transcriptional regulator